MASTSSVPNSDPSLSSDDIAAKMANKRYEGLITVRTKAVKGKGAWYWVHLEPILIRNPDTNLPRAVKLKCLLCGAVFSASNPSRTASEHLKRGTCSNFTSVLTPNSSPLPISSLVPSKNHRKRSSMANSLDMVESTPNVVPIGNNARLNQLETLTLPMLEGSVKKIKSPKNLTRPELSREQTDSALELLADWFFESCGSVSFSSIEHPKFQAFLNQVGLPALSKRDFSGARLDYKFHEAKTESEARIRDVMFFQVASDGWNDANCCSSDSVGGNSIKFVVNLPNGRSVFEKAVYAGGSVSSRYAEETMWEAVTGVCGGVMQRCVGIVADKYKAKALRNLEIQNQWMVNLSCQLRGFLSLIKDFSKEHSLFKRVTENCLKLANFVNTNSQINSFQKYRMQGFEYGVHIRVPYLKCNASSNFGHVYAMLEDIFNCCQVLQMVVLDDSCKAACVEDPIAKEVVGMIKSEIFWSELEAVYSLINIIKGMTQEIEIERPLIGQCLPLWEELRRKVKDWCAKFSIAEGPVEEIVERRFRKNYHPAWSAAFILDPLYLMRDTSGKYLPSFKCLTHDQEKDVDKLITRLVSKEEAHIALMELMKWRSEGLDPLYAQAVQMKQRDPLTGKMKIANPQSSRLVWETCMSEFKALGKVASRLIFLHATSCLLKCNWSLVRWFGVHEHSREGLDRAQRMIFVAAHAKLERRDFSSEEEKDAELFATAGNDMLDEVFVDAPSV